MVHYGTLYLSIDSCYECLKISPEPQTMLIRATLKQFGTTADPKLQRKRQTVQ